MDLSQFKDTFLVAKAIQISLDEIVQPPAEGTLPKHNKVIAFPLVKGTRIYIERIVHQINGCYENAWYDGCSVMIRRLLETLIIECFEKHSIANKIKNDRGDFFYLKDLITALLNETTWNLGRNTKKSLPKLKDIGDKSAHSRRYIAIRDDIDDVKADLRNVIQELTLLAGLK